MKKQFQQIKNFVQDIKDINLNSRDKHDVLSVEMQNAEKRLELIKQVCQSTEKKISACLQLLPSGQLTANNNSFSERNLNQLNGHLSSATGNGSNGLTTGLSLNASLSSNSEDLLIENLLEKKQKKLPEVQLHQTLQELSDLFPADTSILGVTLRESGEIQKQLSKELLRYEQDVERLCLSPLNEILENDIPTLTKARKMLHKTTQELDSLKQKLNQAVKNAQQNPNQMQIKVDTLRRELEEANQRMIQSRDGFAHDLHAFLSREAEFSCIYVQLFKLRANYHKNVLEIIETNMPNLESTILNTSQKPLFGTSLEESAKETGRQMSLVLECCVYELMQHLDEEGLFRVPGSTSKLKKLRTLFNLNAGAKKPPPELLLQLQNDPHSVAGCLKSYLRELPEPLLGYAMYDQLLAAARVSDPMQRLSKLWDIIHQMPPVSLINLRVLIKFLAKLAANSDQNKMNSQNIAIAIAPSLIWAASDRESGTLSGMDMCSANLYGIIVDTLITHSDWFFANELELESLSLNEEVTEHLPAVAPKIVSRHKKPAPPAPIHGPISSTPNRLISDRPTRSLVSSNSVGRSPVPSVRSEAFDQVRVCSTEPSDLESGTSSESKASCSSNCSSNEQLDQPDQAEIKSSRSSLATRSNSISPTNSRLLSGGSLDRRQSRPNNNGSFNERPSAIGLRHCASSASANTAAAVINNQWRQNSNWSHNNNRDRPQSVHIERPSIPPPDAPVRVAVEPNRSAFLSDTSRPTMSTFMRKSNVDSHSNQSIQSSEDNAKAELSLSESHRTSFSTFKPNQEFKRNDHSSLNRTNSTSPTNRIQYKNGVYTYTNEMNEPTERKAPELPAKPPELLQRLQEGSNRSVFPVDYVSNDSETKTTSNVDSFNRVTAPPEKPPRSTAAHLNELQQQFNCDSNSNELVTGSLISCIEVPDSGSSNDQSSTQESCIVGVRKVKPPRPQPPNYKPKLNTEHTHL